MFCAHVFEERGDLEGGLEALAHGHEADVEVVHAYLFEHFFAAAIADHGVHEVRGEAVDELFVLVDDHDLIAEVGQFFGKIGAESSHSDDEYGFHGSPL